MEVRVLTTVPWGLTRMRRYPEAVTLPAGTATVDPVTQTGRWVGSDGEILPATARHKRSETNKETSTKTSLDGNPDQGSDQEGDTD
ncbi:putative ATP-grasp-modified RiPP [Streptomyces sp. NBC_01508]|uniref:putative ATP-grasp-modified RiPP n=1 Tax=Streptomyces sp. NBC_01508 TaxID=2903888 RepID=UPI00386E14B9